MQYVSKIKNGIKIYSSVDVHGYYIICSNGKYHVQDETSYITDPDNLAGFQTFEIASDWLEKAIGADSTTPIKAYTDESDANTDIAMHMIGADKVGYNEYQVTVNDANLYIKFTDKIELIFEYKNGITSADYEITELGYDQMLRRVNRWLKQHGVTACAELDVTSPITAAINTRNLAQYIGRVKSSNIWGYYYYKKDRKTRDGYLLIQFKDKNGGKGDLYIYYDVPFTLYRKLESTSSKGHFFWVYIRNNFQYSKLTGDKRGKLKNAINN